MTNFGKLPPSYVYPVVNDASAAAANATLINAALAAANGQPTTVFIPNSTDIAYFNSTLLLFSGNQLLGLGVQGGGGGILSYTGADATHAISAGQSVSCSKLRIAGIRIQDGRTTPTSGDGIHVTVTNGCIIENCGSFNFPGNGVYIGNTSGTSDNYVVRNIWAIAAGFGLYVDHTAENVLIEDIKGDASATYPFAALIYLKGNSTTGYCGPVINGAKLESDNTTASIVLQVASDFRGIVVANGLTLAHCPGYVVQRDSANAYMVLSNLHSPGTNLGIINDTVTGRVLGSGTNQREVGGPIILGTTAFPAQTLGATAGIVSTITNAGVTLDASYSTVLLSTGGSNRTVALPASATSFGLRYEIKKIDSGAGTAIIDPNASELIDGAATLSLTAQYDAAVIECDGTGWYVVAVKLSASSAPGVASAVYGVKRTGSIRSTIPRFVKTSQTLAAPASGTLYMNAIHLLAGDVIANIVMENGSTGYVAGTGTNYQWFALYDSSRNLLARTADDSGTAWANGAEKTLAVSRVITDAAITSGAATLTSATAAFTSADVGMKVTVIGAGAAGIPLGISSSTVTISSVTNATTAVLSANASTTVSGAVAYIQTPYTITSEADYYLGRLVNSGTAGTQPTCCGCTLQNVNNALIPSGSSTTGLATATPPDPAAALTASGNYHYAYVS